MDLSVIAKGGEITFKKQQVIIQWIFIAVILKRVYWVIAPGSDLKTELIPGKS
jgi:hypothetical protein